MQQSIYSMQFTGKAEPSGQAPNVLRARTVAPSCEISSVVSPDGIEGIMRTVSGQESTFESQVTLTGESTFDESGTICFGDGRNALHFSTVGEGHLGPSPSPLVNHGSVIWKVEGGEGLFQGASGLITSNFTISDTGYVIDNHLGVIYVGSSNG